MKRDPCLLLVSPGILRWTDTDFGLPHLVQIGGYVAEKLGVRVELLDLGYEGGDHRQLARTLDDLGPFHAIGVSCYSSFDRMRVLALGRWLKTLYPDVPLVTGGYHASAVPGDVVFAGSPFDAVVVGEGERAMADFLAARMGGGPLPGPIVAGGVVEDLDELPPYRWDLLARYWPRAHELGRKLQIYLSRGCPYRCTFCMERAKSGYSWRPYSPERAVDELARLARFTDLGRWVVNVADPLFGLHRSWRREVLAGIVKAGILPRQFWTLTRSDDLGDEDVALLARARFSIGIGMESGSPEMLELMQKGNKPDRYLAALERLAALSRKHGLSWAANVILGHPGETRASMRQTRDFVERLFATAPETCGWLSIDPFRLYPGSAIHESMAHWEQRHGTVFHNPEWWKSWYDAPFRAEHVDPSAELSFEGRVRFMSAEYGPIVERIQQRFRGQGRDVDRVFRTSMREQAEQLSPRRVERVLEHARRAEPPARRSAVALPAPTTSVPIGLRMTDARSRMRESALRRLLDAGALRTERVIDALLEVAPERWLAEDEADAMLSDGGASSAPSAAPPFVGIAAVALALEALQVGAGDTAVDMLATRGYVAALLAELVGPTGRVVAICPGSFWARRALAQRCKPLERVEVRAPGWRAGPVDRAWLGAALPRVPRTLQTTLRQDGGRWVGIVGPRFRSKDLVCVERSGDALAERTVARVEAPVLAGPGGWVAHP